MNSWERWQTHSGFRLEVLKWEILLGRSKRKWFLLKLILVSVARRAVATLVAQLFSCPDGEHCFIRERAYCQLFCCSNKKYAACCGLTVSRGNRTVADNDRTHVFHSACAHWQLNISFTSCNKVHKPCVLRYAAMSIIEGIEKLICEVERRPPLYN